MTILNMPLLKPMLAVPAEPFDSEDYLFEIKWDGYRCLCYLNEEVRLLSRNGKDITDAFPELTGLESAVRQKPAVLDGEIIVLEDGMPSFNSLQSRGRLKDKAKIRRAAALWPAVFMAFDILYYGGQSKVASFLVERKEILKDGVRVQDHLLISDYVLEKGKGFAAACAVKGLEGVMAKGLRSPYLPGKRSGHWKKIRNTREADLVICGYRHGKGGRELGALFLGGYRGSEMIYQGKVGTGFDQKEERYILELLAGLQVKEPVLEIAPTESKGALWVKPRLVCSVNYLALTAEGLLRHPVYKGLRSDKLPTACTAL